MVLSMTGYGRAGALLHGRDIKVELRSVNARFEAMTGHYLFEPEFCNRAAGWEKGVVEKNVQDRRKDIWREASERRWGSLDELNDWLEQACLKAWGEMSHPEWWPTSGRTNVHVSCPTPGRLMAMWSSRCGSLPLR